MSPGIYKRKWQNKKCRKKDRITKFCNRFISESSSRSFASVKPNNWVPLLGGLDSIPDLYTYIMCSHNTVIGKCNNVEYVLFIFVVYLLCSHVVVLRNRLSLVLYTLFGCVMYCRFLLRSRYVYYFTNTQRANITLRHFNDYLHYKTGLINHSINLN